MENLIELDKRYYIETCNYALIENTSRLTG